MISVFYSIRQLEAQDNTKGAKNRHKSFSKTIRYSKMKEEELWLSCFHSEYFSPCCISLAALEITYLKGMNETCQSILQMTPSRYRNVKSERFKSPKYRHLPTIHEQWSPTPVPVDFFNNVFPNELAAGLSTCQTGVLSEPGYSSFVASRVPLWSEQVPFVEIIRWSESPAGRGNSLFPCSAFTVVLLLKCPSIWAKHGRRH